ncbi:MAG: hypothetical protein CVU59_09290 [Deltaproteobacteria bacterium HGW-Deltaproteobacteria-17]|nr:MAG: hypothetical protein CVU59_09290 [Deltaproteobacteria bacterium HGW-Deltaproteobacteria-17]
MKPPGADITKISSPLLLPLPSMYSLMKRLRLPVVWQTPDPATSWQTLLCVAQSVPATHCRQPATEVHDSMTVPLQRSSPSVVQPGTQEVTQVASWARALYSQT